MKVRLERTFAMPASAERTWIVLSDIERVAGCMPGAKITQRVDDTHYKGTVAVKLGPANLTFRGDIEVKALDAATRTLTLSAKGNDTTGASFATMDLTARVEPAADGTSALVGMSEASVGGKAAAFGGRMMDAVSDQILKQFAANFAARVAEAEAALAAPATGQPRSASGTPAGDASAAIPGATPASARAVDTGPAVATQQAELNGFALLWAIFRDWLRGLFRRKPG
jgi:carbon monoxide dehydrogenase subunit G